MRPSRLAGSTQAVAWAMPALVVLSCCEPAPRTIWTEGSTGMEFVRLEAGEFTVGSPPDEPDREARETRHRVRLTRPIFLGRAEVTQAQWQTVMGSNPSRFQPPEFDACPDCPVETVNYWQVQEFLSRLSARSGHRFRLPTEAEWEVACRADADTAFAFGDSLDPSQANFDADGSTPEERGRTTAAGTYPPNPWGLFDLHGNVWELTTDPLCPYAEAEVVDPRPDCDSP